MAALRGPDKLGDVTGLKHVTTAVIRGVMQKVIRVGGQVNQKFAVIIAPLEWPPAGTIGAWSADHFFTHIYDAAVWLRLPVVRVNGYWDWVASPKPDLSHVLGPARELLEHSNPAAPTGKCLRHFIAYIEKKQAQKETYQKESQFYENHGSNPLTK